MRQGKQDLNMVRKDKVHRDGKKILLAKVKR